MDAQALAALELPAILERLAEAAETAHGAAAARALEPSGEAAVVAERQADTSEAVELLAYGAAPTLAGAAALEGELERAERGGLLRPSELRTAARSIRVTLEAKRVLTERVSLAPRFASLFEPVPSALVSLADAIDRAVEEDGSDLRDSASPLLRRLRNELRTGGARVRDELEKVARLADARAALQETFFAERGGRPVLAVRAVDRAKVPGIVHDTSSSGQTLFVEPFAVVELSNRLAEAAAAARDEAERILTELSAATAAHAAGLRIAGEATGRADLALAAGGLSRRLGGAPVEVADEIRLLEARHPLLDPVAAVPIDLDLGALRALVISGPNTGGKTVALKTLGLAALLHQIGLRPPCASATLPVFDTVLADIGDRQSIAMSLSTFSGHVRSIIDVLNAATERSLVLLDEVAGGTDPDEGSALARALVDQLARQARLTVVTTHYGALKDWASSTDGAANATTGFDLERDEPLYRLALGRAGASHALRIAERLGLRQSVVADARELLGPVRLRTDRLLAEAETAERRAAARLGELERTLEAAEAREAELAAAVAATEASRERVRADAAAEAARELADARSELARLRDDVRAARRLEGQRAREATRTERSRDRLLGQATERAGAAERALRSVVVPPAQLAPLAPGDPVEAPSLGVRGTIAEIRGAEAEIVGSGGGRIRLALSALRPSAEPAGPAAAPPVTVRATASARDVSDELDVRGQTAVDARDQVRAFADAAAIAGLRSVRVVHGRGTGALRTAIRAELSAHPLVERLEPAAEDGATVVHLG